MKIKIMKFNSQIKLYYIIYSCKQKKRFIHIRYFDKKKMIYYWQGQVFIIKLSLP